MKYTTLLLMGLGLVALAGCTVARGPAGEVVIGVEVGVLAETAEQVAIGLAGQVPVVGGMLQQMMIGAVGSGATIGGVAKMLLNKLEKRRRDADIAREKAERRVAELEAEKAATSDSG